MNKLTSSNAQIILNRAIEKANELNINVCIAITDPGAHLLLFYRMNNAFLGSIEVAIAKARTSTLFPVPTGDFGQLIREEKLTGMELTNTSLIGFHGGVPIIKNDELIGAVGISGGSAEQDKIIATFSIENSC